MSTIYAIVLYDNHSACGIFFGVFDTYALAKAKILEKLKDQPNVSWSGDTVYCGYKMETQVSIEPIVLNEWLEKFSCCESMWK